MNKNTQSNIHLQYFKRELPCTSCINPVTSSQHVEFLMNSPVNINYSTIKGQSTQKI